MFHKVALIGRTCYLWAIVIDAVSHDFNRDGLADILMSATQDQPNFYIGSKLFLFINQGDGNFRDETNTLLPDLGTDFKWGEKIHLEDLNNDERIDIIVHQDIVSPDQLIPLLIQQADGSFEIFDDFEPTDVIHSLFPIDIDNDGDIDLISRNVIGDPLLTQRHTLNVLENVTSNDNALNFLPLSASVATNEVTGGDSSDLIYSPAILDINNDGFNDFILGGPIEAILQPFN